MSADWPLVRLGDHINSCLGKMLDKKKNKGSPQPYLGNSNVRWGAFDLSDLAEMKFEDSEHERYGLKYGDLIVCEGGEPGRSAIWRDETPNMKIQKALHRIRPKRSLHNFYLYYWFMLSAKSGWLEPYFTGTTIKHLTGKALNELQLPLPPLHYQEAAAGILRSLDEKIHLNHQINQTLEQMAQAIFKSWFVDFEPVRAKIAALEAGSSEQDALLAAMQAISGKDEAALARLKAEQPEQYAELQVTAELFPAAMRDSELGEIPEGWEVLPLSSMVNLIGGGTPKKSEPSYWDGNICWFSVKDAPSEGNVFVIDTEEKITDAGLKGSSTKLLPIGTTIITARGTVGKLALTGVVTAMNQSCYGVVGNDGTGPYLNYLRLYSAVDTLKRNTHGAVFDTITRTTFETVVQPQACLGLRQKFEEVVEPMFKAIKTGLHQVQTLSELRDTLLPKLLSGEISLEDIETDEVATA
ncbi:restriction endonuclease subunit S [Zobellella denitrificans]